MLCTRGHLDGCSCAHASSARAAARTVARLQDPARVRTHERQTRGIPTEVARMPAPDAAPDTAAPGRTH
eukprot:11396886-Alexandrium_andersonii.AAC.1